MWLDPDFSDEKQLGNLLTPYPDNEMEANPISSRINSPRNEGPEAVVPKVG